MDIVCLSLVHFLINKYVKKTSKITGSIEIDSTPTTSVAMDFISNTYNWFPWKRFASQLFSFLRELNEI